MNCTPKFHQRWNFSLHLKLGTNHYRWEKKPHSISWTWPNNNWTKGKDFSLSWSSAKLFSFSPPRMDDAPARCLHKENIPNHIAINHLWQQKKTPKTQLVPGKSQMENFTLNGFFCGLGERERSDNALKSGLGRKFMSWFFFLSFSSIYLILWDLCALHPVESWRRTEFNRFQL